MDSPERRATEPVTAEPVTPEPVAPDGPPLRTRTLLTQDWQDLAMLHWPVDPAAVAPLLPAGTVPDLFEGTTYVGLIAFRMYGIGFLGLPRVPYFGTFPETNVRLYSVDERGRRAVVFRSLEAARLVPVLVARAGFRLPYTWARMRVRREGPGGRVLTYTSGRRWPGPVGAAARIRIRAGEPIAEPTALEHFLTARWALHTTLGGTLAHLPNTHPRWPLHRAELLECRETLIAAAGLDAPLGPPASVLYSPGVPVRFGRPER
ncbi:YqjF family protein [Streptomyces sp. NBC_01497]|uniref:YqjF family protein n=1 Tax=Streptomyces sp. NBC_01497 TaxID=2903885 RepID=UPI002E381F2B|nr:DUF2071 domain-containing protein [Streptomyces sp. NBC_01497]